MTRGMIKFAGVLVIALIGACGDDDDAQPNKGGRDSGSPNSDGGQANVDGGSTGSGGKKGTGTGTGTGSGGKNGGGGGAQSSDGGGGTGNGGDASVDAGSTSGGDAAMDASTTDSSTAMQPAPGCPGLLDCCAQLPMAQQMNCELVANNADDATCDQFKTVVCPVADGGTVDPQACMTLNACCDSLPRGPTRVACATTVTNNDPLNCAQVQEAFCPTGGDPNACMSLTDCCAGLPPPQRNSCNMIVDQGLPSACETVMTALCP